MASARLFQVASCSSVVASTNLDVARSASSSSSSSRLKSGWQLGCQSLRTALPPARCFAPACRQSHNVICQAVSTSPETETEAETNDASSIVALEVVSSDGDESPAQAKKPTKHLKNLMETLQRQAIEAALTNRTLPDIRPGDVVQLRLEVPENKRRISLLRGIVIAKHNSGINTTFRIRRMISGVGVEIVFPLYSPNIKELKVLDHRKVRRAKLYYLRDKIARLSTC